MQRLFALALAVAGAAAGYACGSSPATPQTTPATASSQQTRVAGEYLIAVAVPDDVKAITDVYGRFGIKGIKEIGPNVFLVTLGEDPGPAAMEKLRDENARIKSVEPNYLYRTQ